MEDINKFNSDNASSDDLEQHQKMLKKTFIKMCIPIVLGVAIICFFSIAWFAMNGKTEATSTGVKAQETPYTILTRGENGYYKDKWEKTGSEALEWLVSKENNFDNHGQDLDYEEEKPGLEPGDSGVLEFRVHPNTSDSITVDCVFQVKAYLETVVQDDRGNVMLDAKGDPVTTITEIKNDTLTGYIKAHIMLFSGYDSENNKYTGLIGDDQALRRVLKDQTYTRNDTNDTTYTKIYWVWPMHLEDITSNDASKLIYDSGERTSVIEYIASNRDGFFKDCNDDEQKVKSDLTALSQAYDNSIYNYYNMKYDNADLAIGNNISYMMLSMNVENIEQQDE